MRYGLRGQMLFNLGLAMLISCGIFGLSAHYVDRVSWFREQTRTYKEMAALLEGLLARLAAQGLLPSSLPRPSSRPFHTEARSNPSSRPFQANTEGSSLHRLLRNHAEGAFWEGLMGEWAEGRGFVPRGALVLDRLGRERWRFGRVTRREIERLGATAKLGRDSWEVSRRKASLLHLERWGILRWEDRQVGALWMAWDLSSAKREAPPTGLLLLYLLLFCLLMLVILLLFLRGRMIKPLERLGGAIERMAERRRSGGLEEEILRSDEIGDLARSFVRMEALLQAHLTTQERQLLQIKQAKEALERAQEELVLREKMATVGQMAAGVAHEVGNPLSAIMGYAELLQESEEWGAVEKDMTARIAKETQRIDRIIRDLLAYSKPVKETRPASPLDAIHEALDLLRLQKRFRGMTVETSLPPSLPKVTIPVSPLIQVLINLFLNAADACKGKGVIRLSASLEVIPPVPPDVREASTFVVLRVQDDGPGIPDDLLSAIFEPFVTTKGPGEGVGLGLAICKRLVVSAGGQIEAKRADEGGAIFVLRLPLASETPTSQVS